MSTSVPPYPYHSVRATAYHAPPAPTSTTFRPYDRPYLPVTYLVLSVHATRNNTIVTLSEKSVPQIVIAKRVREERARVAAGVSLNEEGGGWSGYGSGARGVSVDGHGLQGGWEDSGSALNSPTAGALPGSVWEQEVGLSNVGERPEEAEKEKDQDEAAQEAKKLQEEEARALAEIERLVHVRVPPSRVLLKHSGGTVGFKKVNRESYEAGYQCGLRMIKAIETLLDKQDVRLEIHLDGFGQGRDAVMQSILGSEGLRMRTCVRAIVDTTKIKFGGVRAKKLRKI